jgi:hypothetical protein
MVTEKAATGVCIPIAAWNQQAHASVRVRRLCDQAMWRSQVPNRVEEASRPLRADGSPLPCSLDRNHRAFDGSALRMATHEEELVA